MGCEAKAAPNSQRISAWRITDPDLCASGALTCRGLLSRSRAVAGSEGGKTTLGNTVFLRPKSRIFSQFVAKSCLDNMTGIQYLNTIIACRSMIAV